MGTVTGVEVAAGTATGVSVAVPAQRTAPVVETVVERVPLEAAAGPPAWVWRDDFHRHSARCYWDVVEGRWECAGGQ